MLQQLNKTQAHISIWELFFSSHEQRRAMVEAFRKIMVSVDTNPMVVIQSIQQEAEQVITITENELPMEGRNHKRPLFI